MGRMGLPMSYRLLEAGFDLTVHNRSQGKVQEIARAGGRTAVSATQIGDEADVVLTCLPDVASVEEVFLGNHGILDQARPGQVFVDHSTVGIGTSKACAAAAESRGATFLDAPISGGTERAANGTLTIMAGGPKDSFDRVWSIFEAMGTTVRHIGPTGTGTTVKLVNQLLVGIHSVAAAEAMLLGAKSGADPQLVFDVVTSVWGQSFLLGRNAPVMLDRSFEGIRTQIKVFLKDLTLIKELAAELNVPTPANDLSLQAITDTIDGGLGDLDAAAIVQPMEQRAGFQIQRL